MLEYITPVLLTFNEECNIERTLSRLHWAADIVVVDSASTDRTLQLLKKNPRVRIFTRPFDTHARQWQYAIMDTAIITPWILRLDADYLLTDELIQELQRLNPEAPVSAYRVAFDYIVFSRRLRSSMYPPNTILLRRGKFRIQENGHTERWMIDGSIATLRGRVLHDDRKRTDFWLNAQSRYMKREWAMIAERPFGLKNWVRLRPPLAPFLVFFYCMLGKGLILNGRAGLFYALQRMVAEATLALMALESRLITEADSEVVDEDDR